MCSIVLFVLIRLPNKKNKERVRPKDKVRSYFKVWAVAGKNEGNRVRTKGANDKFLRGC